MNNAKKSLFDMAYENMSNSIKHVSAEITNRGDVSGAIKAAKQATEFFIKLEEKESTKTTAHCCALVVLKSLENYEKGV